MTGTVNNREYFSKAYANGSLKIEHKDGMLTFSGSTYHCKETLKDFGCTWDRYNKVWRGSDQMPDQDLGLLNDLTGDEDSDLLIWLGVIDGVSTYKWLR